MRDFEDAMLDIACKNLDHENTRFKDIDTKAIGIITITGIVVTFLAKPANLEMMSAFLFIMTSLSFLAAILFSVMVIRVRSGEVLSTEILVNNLKKKEHEHQIRGIICTIAKAENELVSCKTCNVITFIIYILHNRFEGTQYDEIYRNTFQRRT